MHRINRIGVLSLGRVMGVFGVVFGFLAGVIYGTVMVLVGAAGMGSGEEEGLFLLLLGGGLCIGLPLVYGAFMFVMGLLYGVVINFAFRLFGGLEIELEKLRG